MLRHPPADRHTQVPDYIDEAADYFVFGMLLELAVLVLLGKGKSYNVGDTVTSIHSGTLSQLMYAMRSAMGLTVYSWMYSKVCGNLLILLFLLLFIVLMRQSQQVYL